MEFTEFRGIIVNELTNSSRFPQKDIKGKQSEKIRLKNSSQKLTNEQRLANLKQLHKSDQSREKLISDALKNKGTNLIAVNKKIKFDDSDDDEYNHKKISVEKYEPTKNGVKITSNKSFKLFDEDDNNNNVADEIKNSFRVPPQYQGKAGQKLMAMQTKFGGDLRFKMNETFLDDFKTADEDEQNVSTFNDNDDSHRTEQKQQINILEKVLGKSVKTKVLLDEEETSQKISHRNKSKPSTTNCFIARYDPENPSHYHYRRPVDATPPVVDEEKNDAKKRKEKKKIDDKDVEEKDAKIKVRDDKKEYKIDKDFADRLRKTAKNSDAPKTSSFSILASLGRTNVQPETSTPIDRNDMGTKFESSFTPISLTNSSDNRTKKRSDISQNNFQNLEQLPPETTSTERTRVMKKSVSRSFFFCPDDPRLKEGEKFCRKQNLETVRANWEGRRVFLISLYKKRRKDAVRRMKKTKEAKKKYFKNQKKPSKNVRQKN